MDIPEINLNITTRKIEAKTRKLPSHISLYFDDEYMTQVMYDNTVYTEQDIIDQLENDKKTGELKHPNIYYYGDDDE